MLAAPPAPETRDLAPVIVPRAPEGTSLRRIQDQGVLRWGIDPAGGAPFSMPDPRDPRQLVGFEIDLVERLCQYFGAKEGVLVVHAPDEGAIKLQDGDVIVRIGERKPANPEQVLRILRSYEPGESFKLEVLRNRKTVALEVKVPERGGPRGGEDAEVDAVDIIIRP